MYHRHDRRLWQKCISSCCSLALMHTWAKVVLETFPFFNDNYFNENVYKRWKTRLIVFCSLLISRFLFFFFWEGGGLMTPYFLLATRCFLLVISVRFAYCFFFSMFIMFCSNFNHFVHFIRHFRYLDLYFLLVAFYYLLFVCYSIPSAGFLSLSIFYSLPVTFWSI